MHDRYQLLLAEGAESDADLIVSELGRAGLDFEFQRVVSRSEMEKALAAKPWDFIIFGEHLPGFTWATAVMLCKQRGLDVPFIMLSAVADADPGVDRIKAGVHEHVLKNNLMHLPQVVRRELRSLRERRIREHAQMTARLLEPRPAFNHVAVLGLASDGTIVSWDAGAERIYGYSASEMIGRSLSASLVGEAFAFLRTDTGAEPGKCVETTGRRKDDSPLRMQVVLCPIHDQAGRNIGASVLVRDLTQGKEWSQVDVASFFGTLGRTSLATERRTGQP